MMSDKIIVFQTNTGFTTGFNLNRIISFEYVKSKWISINLEDSRLIYVTDDAELVMSLANLVTGVYDSYIEADGYKTKRVIYLEWLWDEFIADNV